MILTPDEIDAVRPTKQDYDRINKIAEDFSPQEFKGLEFNRLKGLCTKQAVAQAQIDKLANLTPEQVRDEIADIIATDFYGSEIWFQMKKDIEAGKSPYATVNAMWGDVADQISALLTAQVQEAVRLENKLMADYIKENFDDVPLIRDVLKAFEPIKLKPLPVPPWDASISTVTTGEGRMP